MGASGDVMFGPWAAYFPVSRGHEYDILTMSNAGHIQILFRLADCVTF